MAENAVMEKAGEIFGKKYGGIPFPVILIGVGVTAYAIRSLIKKQQSAKTVDSQPVDPNGYVVDASGNKFASAYTGAGGGVTPFGTGSLTNAGTPNLTVPTPITETNNEGWLRRASDQLTSAGMWDPILIQTALMKYISGSPLNQRESAIANQAVKMQGQPPVNVDPGQTSTGSTILRLLNPAGSPAIFAQYDTGEVAWVSDPIQLQRIQAAQPDLTVTTLATSDPIWRQADVVQNRSQTFLDSEKAYKAANPGQYSPYSLFQ